MLKLQTKVLTSFLSKYLTLTYFNNGRHNKKNKKLVDQLSNRKKLWITSEINATYTSLPSKLGLNLY